MEVDGEGGEKRNRVDEQLLNVSCKSGMPRWKPPFTAGTNFSVPFFCVFFGSTFCQYTSTNRPTPKIERVPSVLPVSNEADIPLCTTTSWSISVKWSIQSLFEAAVFDLLMFCCF